MLAENLAKGLEPGIAENDEFVVSYGDHETNVGPWIRLASRKNAKVIPWIPRIAPTASSSNPFAVELVISDLENLITSRTRLVSFTACSNILGAWTNPKKVIEAVRRLCTEKGAAKVEVVVDCVAYAPHRRIDVQDWDVDYCFFSYYKASSAALIGCLPLIQFILRYTDPIPLFSTPGKHLWSLLLPLLPTTSSNSEVTARWNRLRAYI
ncbi:hypothetical protein FRC03_001976 [Tulasnella sp. 419]|nr:hypothetical protein FRC03_001976 [Tulasnella sp. 419]